MSWVETKLGEICTLHYGKSLKGYQDNTAEDNPVQVFGTNGPIGWTKKPLTQRPTIVIGRKGAYRGVHIAKRSSWTIDTAYYSELDEDRVSLPWMYYRLKLLDINSMNSGAAIPSTKREDFYSASIKVPDLPTQERIAGVLSAYDDLIENNRRRIALLEQAARLLYREWFVHFRFPGYETAKFVDGLPEGWEETTIKQHCPFIYGKALKADARVDGDVDVFGSSGIVGSHNKPLVAGEAIVVGRKGNVGSVYWAGRSSWPIDTVYYIAPENSDYFTFFALQHMSFINTDVAVPGLNRDFAHSRKLVLPSDDLLEDFNARAALYFGQVQGLTKTNEKLAKARDLLLPRLMDGRLNIS